MLHVFLVVAAPVLALYYYCSVARQGVRSYVSPPALRRRSQTAQRMRRQYEASRGAQVYRKTSWWAWWRPVLVIRDLDVAKKVLVRDCGDFSDRNSRLGPAFCPVIRDGLYNSAGCEWKALRFNLASVFSTARTAALAGRIHAASLNLRTFLQDAATKGEAVALDEVLYRFSADLVASAVFGVDARCLQEPGSPFLMHAKVLADHFHVTDGCSSSLAACLVQLLNPYDVSAAERFFQEAVQSAIAQPAAEPDSKTFVQLLLETSTPTTSSCPRSVQWIAAQACSFVVLGLRSLTLLLTAALVELARHGEVQARLWAEVNTCPEVDAMTYLDKVVAETLRKWPPVLELVRVTTRACSLPCTSLRLRAQTEVTVPVFAIHRDPEHFPDPERFDPDRFNEDANLERHSCGYLPFGDGPRNCIGMRFAVLSAKVCLATILSTLEFQTCDPEDELDSYSFPQGKTARLRVRARSLMTSSSTSSRT